MSHTIKCCPLLFCTVCDWLELRETWWQKSLWGRQHAGYNDTPWAVKGIYWNLGERAVYTFNCNYLSLGRVWIMVCLKETLLWHWKEMSSALSTPIILKIIRWNLRGSEGSFKLSWSSTKKKKRGYPQIQRRESLYESLPSESSVFRSLTANSKKYINAFMDFILMIYTGSSLYPH